MGGFKMREKKSIGESLVEEGIITLEQLKEAEEEGKISGKSLRKILINKGFITEEDFVEFLSNKLKIPKINLNNYLIDPQIIELVPEELARKHKLIPVLKVGNRLTCAMVEPWNIFALDEVREKTGLVVEPVVATEKEVKKALDEYYGVKGNMEEIVEAISKKDLISSKGELDVKELEGIVEEPVVIKLVNLIIMQAVKEKASDVHIEPEEDKLKIRFRIDGILHQFPSPPKHFHSAIVSRIKIMANLDIAERRKPQDGRFNIKMEGRQIDVRVSCVPTIYGENIVLRLLDTSNMLLELSQLGFSQEVLEKYEKLITHSHGIILVTGPTGSGKTTTLYASLNKINTVEKNIITIEDPVEYKIEGIRQIQVNPKVNLTFDQGLRSVLRQDPDIIMVGEIRDLDTAETAIHAALTGHLVFYTLHTNYACGAITRLIDMGVEPFLVSSSLIGVLAQRLVRRICEDCREEYTPSSEILEEIGLKEKEGVRFYRGRGCSKCKNQGYRGRIGIFELMVPNDKIRNLTVAKAPLEEIRKEAILSGMVTLKDDGIEKIKNGLTTIEEVLRVIRD
jgi:type IV pilus assembly protein PilB